MKALLNHFNKILPMSETEIKELTPLLKTRILLKDEFLLGENQVCNFLAFVKKGFFRSFYVSPSGRSTNMMLNSEGELISNYDSFMSGVPSNISIQSTKKSEVILIYKRDLDKLLENSLYWNKLGRILVEKIFIIAKNRLESIIYKTPEDRYLDLITYSPNFLEQFSLTDIASFIGVTPQSLSRIRARI